MPSRRGIYMSSEKVMNGNIPFPRKLQPIARIPPVGIEMTIRETSDLCKCTKNVLEDDQEYEKEGNHERKEQPGDGLSEDESAL